MEEIMARHNTAFLNSILQIMVGVFGPSVDKHFEQDESSATAAGVNTRKWYRKEADLWAELGDEIPFG
jgi:hypothetical protein